MSNSTLPNGLTFLRWNLNPLAAALWHQAAKQVSQQMDARPTWIEVDPKWDSKDPIQLDSSRSLHESEHAGRPTALVVGIDRTRFVEIVTRTRILREFCNQTFFESATNSERITERIFLIGWFPQADRESMRLLRELGFDLVLHDPASLKSSLTKIFLCSVSLM